MFINYFYIIFIAGSNLNSNLFNRFESLVHYDKAPHKGIREDKSWITYIIYLKALRAVPPPCLRNPEGKGRERKEGYL